jgi:hypothetical protein
LEIVPNVRGPTTGQQQRTLDSQKKAGPAGQSTQNPFSVKSFQEAFELAHKKK